MSTRRIITYVSAACLLAWTGCSQTTGQAGIAGKLGPHDRSAASEKAKPAPMPRIQSQTHLAAGRVLDKQGDVKAAIAQYEKAIAGDPKLVAAYSHLALIYQKIGRTVDAEHIFRQGIRADPDAAMLRNNLGYFYLVQRRYDQAEREFREALTISPDFKRARMNLAITLAQIGRKQDSLKEFGRIVSADIAQYNLAVVCLNRHDYVGAEAALRSAVAINPDCPGAAQQLERVRTILAAAGRTDSPTEAPTSVPLLAGNPEGDGTDVP